MMNEEFNPYTAPAQNAAPAPATAPQPPFNQQVANPQPAVPPQGYAYQQPARPVQPQPQTPQQPVAQQPPVRPQNGQPVPPRYPQPPVYPYTQPVSPEEASKRAARGFGMASFIIGCFALVITTMIYFNFRSSVSAKFGAALAYSILIGIPGLVFAVVSLMKKPEKKVFPLLGLAFSLVLMLCAFITYFVMVNFAPGYYY